MKNDRFAKTDSGQMRGKSKQTWSFQYLWDEGAVRAVLAVTPTADHRDVRSDVIHLVPGALVLTEAEALHEKALLLQEPVVAVLVVGEAARVDEIGPIAGRGRRGRCARRVFGNKTGCAADCSESSHRGAVTRAGDSIPGRCRHDSAGVLVAARGGIGASDGPGICLER